MLMIDGVRREDILWTYTEAQAEISNAMCSMDDDEVSDRFIANRLYSALYSLTEMILLVHNNNDIPSDIVSRVAMVDVEEGYRYVPNECRRLLEDRYTLDRECLSGIAQVIDCWACMLGNKYNRYLTDKSASEYVRALVS